jgi:hypothetical protein
VGKLVGSIPPVSGFCGEIVGRGSVCAITALIGKRKHKSPMAVFDGDFFYFRETSVPRFVRPLSNQRRSSLYVSLWARYIRWAVMKKWVAGYEEVLFGDEILKRKDVEIK